MHIGCLFGTFDPPHMGHLAIAAHVREAAGFDLVWLVVTPRNPFKQDVRITDDHHRLEMVRLAIGDQEGLEVSDFELQLPVPNYTADSLQAMCARWPEHRFSLIMGSDNLAGFHRWKDPEAILAHHGIWVYPRPGWGDHLQQAVYAAHPSVHLLHHAPLMDLSATSIREKVGHGLGTEGLLAPAVAGYIREHRLYTD